MYINSVCVLIKLPVGRRVTHRFLQVSKSLYVKETEPYPGLLQPHCREAVITDNN